MKKLSKPPNSSSKLEQLIVSIYRVNQKCTESTVLFLGLYWESKEVPVSQFSQMVNWNALSTLILSAFCLGSQMHAKNCRVLNKNRHARRARVYRQRVRNCYSLGTSVGDVTRQRPRAIFEAQKRCLVTALVWYKHFFDRITIKTRNSILKRASIVVILISVHILSDNNNNNNCYSDDDDNDNDNNSNDNAN